MLKSVDLESYMITNPLTIRKEADLFEAVDIILSNKVSGLCVVDEHGRLEGILSEIDCLQAILNATYNQDMVGSVSEYMADDDLLVAKVSDNIINLGLDMVGKSHRRRPVVDENNVLVGQITCRQLMVAVREFAKTQKHDWQVNLACNKVPSQKLA